MNPDSPFDDFVARLTPLMAASAGDAPSDFPFEDLARELHALQRQHNAPYRRLCESRPLGTGSRGGLGDIPCVPTSSFKEVDWSSLPAPERTRCFHSSGTTAVRPSRHHHSPASLAVYEASLLPWFRHHLMPADGGPSRRMTLLSLTPHPGTAPHSSLAHMMGTVFASLGTEDSSFAGRVDSDGGWVVDVERARQALEQAAAGGQPICVLGTAFNWVHLLDALDVDRWAGGTLPAGSRVMETGGYKGRSREIPKAELHDRISTRLGIPPGGVICEYGMSELSSQAYDGRWTPAGGGTSPRVFRFPPWARARVLSPETGREVEPGAVGRIQVFDLANVFSVAAVQTEDLGRRVGDGFELLGRAGGAESRGCSLQSPAGHPAEALR